MTIKDCLQYQFLDLCCQFQNGQLQLLNVEEYSLCVLLDLCCQFQNGQLQLFKLVQTCPNLSKPVCTL